MITFTHKCCVFETPHDVLHTSTSAPSDTILTYKRSENTVSKSERAYGETASQQSRWTPTKLVKKNVNF